MSRRYRWRTSLTGILAVFGVALAMATPLAAQTVKIGVILSYSGPAASIGEQLDNAIKLYVKEHEKELPAGVKLEIIRRDDTGPNPDVAKRLAQELITRDKVQFLTGVIWTPNANAIAPLSAEAKVPFVIMNAAGVGTTRLSPYVARTSFTLWQSCYPLAEWAAKQGMKTAYTLVSDYAPGFDAEDAFTKGFTKAGGTIMGSVRVPLKDPDFIPFVQRAKDAKPDVLFIFAPSGKQATAVMKAYGDLGLAAAGIKLIGPQDIVTDEELPNMGDAPLGVVTAGVIPRRRRGRRTKLSSRLGSAITARMRTPTSWRPPPGTEWPRSLPRSRRRMAKSTPTRRCRFSPAGRTPRARGARSRSTPRRATSSRTSIFAGSSVRATTLPMSNSRRSRRSRTRGRC